MQLPPRWPRLPVLAAAAFVLGGCSDTTSSPQPDTPSPALRVTSPHSISTLADQYRELARLAPGFASVYFDSLDRLVINTATDEFSPRSVAAVLDWVVTFRGPLPASQAIRISRTPYDYLALDEAVQLLTPHVRAASYPAAIRIDDVTSRIVVTVPTQHDSLAFSEGAATDGLAPGMVQVEVAGSPPMRDATLQDRVRPTIGGLLIISDHANGCSLGFNGYKVVNGQPDPSQGRFFMTAAHCMNRIDSVTGTVWGQNALPPFRVGVEVHVSPVFTGSPCPYWACQVADEAVVQYDDSVPASYGRVAQTSKFGGITIVGQWDVNGNVYGAIAGERVYKVGQITGTTSGIVQSTCASFPPSQGFPGVYCAASVTYTSQNGDSGAPVFIPYDPARPSTTPRTVGVHFGSFGAYRYYSRIDAIWSAQNSQYWW